MKYDDGNTMSTMNKYLIEKEDGIIQIPYQDYVALIDKVEENRHIRLVKDRVIAGLQGSLGGKSFVADVTAKGATVRGDVEKDSAPAEKVSVEFEADAPAVESVQRAKVPVASERHLPDMDVPPTKKNIAVHFNNHDASGRLFGVYQQYYACLNDACGGTVHVTMKDGFCSLWNYGEWEEFAFIDIFEGQLRIALDPRYTEGLQSLNLCEVPRQLSRRRNLVCVQVDGLNNTMLNVLVKAFEEVGLTVS